ncbi:MULTISPECIES: mandelate racemase/muconate lactonizing enzyme family protein [unclassified Methylococcus]|uniref:mandelate racemase/muconate lactonizing enzyme family protein n=1 Tax=unclassified Methylococcus TaxID=2618889 RepID=UPI003D7E825E
MPRRPPAPLSTWRCTIWWPTVSACPWSKFWDAPTTACRPRSRSASSRSKKRWPRRANIWRSASGFSRSSFAATRSKTSNACAGCTKRWPGGPSYVVRVDPNQSYDRDGLLRLDRLVQELGIEFVEQPFPAGRTDWLRALPKAIRRRIAADESLLGPADAFALAAPPAACGIFNIKLMKCGGLAPARRIATIAETAGIDLMWGCMDESRISIAAALHAALACPATRYLDLDGSFDLARDVAEGGFILEDGRLRVTERPGLGLVYPD